MSVKKKRNSSLIMKPNFKQFLDEDKTLKYAYKNVIRVITNILGNIEEEKTNGKINYLNLSFKSKKGKRTLMPKQSSKFNTKIKLDVSPKSMKAVKKNYKKSNSKESHFFSNISNNSIIINKSPPTCNKNVDVPIIQIIKTNESKEKKNNLINKSYNNIKVKDELKNSTICTGVNKSKFNKSNRLKVENSFASLFTPRNKKINKSQNTNMNSPKKMRKLSIIQKESQNSLSIFNDESNISLSSSTFTPYLLPKK